ncbi:hypothetical protein FDG94_gp117 [Pseudomonas phage SM1]|uniref:Uncharacterized protein n=1 Tax=Pseudomonas phage SM1 TaxID=1772332 RepID=A0A0U3DEG1_9CAUD|nr:hypothetical protein FDG94_gp117 [Pseudomonas phage SM1]ALT58109.1 hypothetical protein SM1_0117 [Pseudomonas phage SM1]UVN14030.1 hypothetical protein FBPa45_0028 [Pseudomonas phage vB_PaeS_FBPa45]HBO9768516.1 hypothetical protein [Pseudomonas aeruginosa]
MQEQRVEILLRAIGSSFDEGKIRARMDDLAKGRGPQTATMRQELAMEAGYTEGAAIAVGTLLGMTDQLTSCMAHGYKLSERALALTGDLPSGPLLDTLLELRNYHIAEGNKIWNGIWSRMEGLVVMLSGMAPSILNGSATPVYSEFVDIIKQMYRTRELHYFMVWLDMRHEGKSPSFANHAGGLAETVKDRQNEVDEELLREYVEWGRAEYKRLGGALAKIQRECPFPDRDAELKIAKLFGVY